MQIYFVRANKNPPRPSHRDNEKFGASLSVHIHVSSPCVTKSKFYIILNEVFVTYLNVFIYGHSNTILH